ncbi:M3 family metallopeptidase [Novosphingobium sp. PhB165]|uniref:M3 family metallopeptidase n=1 Tax=Novosphingobium sp. PhB165 TaxID=2485105 RepID=UPI00104C04C6|nr:M3 family metallopeptidase [Novosphingobium sp. PhB165]
MATPEVAKAAPAPVDTFIGSILADAPDAAALNARCDKLAGEIDRRIAELEAERGAATDDGTLQRFDDIYDLIAATQGEFGLFREVMADAPRRDAGAACEVRMQNASAKLSLSRPVYDRLKAVDAGTDPATRYYLTRSLEAFDRAGVAQSPDGRKAIQALQDRIAANGTAFEKGIADARKTLEADPAELAGLPDDFIAAHPAGANGKVTLSTDSTDIVPVLTYARSDDLRERVLRASRTRGYPQNDILLTNLLNDRAQLASDLGRKDYSALALEDRMLNTPAKVDELLGGVETIARPIAERDYAKLLAERRRDDPGASELTLWQLPFYTQRVQQRDYSYDAQEARKYFSYAKVRDGILKLTSDLFGVEIRPWRTATWDPRVETYEMVENGKVIGAFYFDSHPRPGKYEHANMIGLRMGIAGRSIPVGALVTNVSAGEDADALMEHGDVVTFLHEFGHMLHHIFGGQTARWAGQSGVANEWDFVEAPSQMLEQWAYDYDTLATFASDAQGKPIPRELVASMNRARYFGRGMDELRGVAYSEISLRLHQAPAPADLGAATRAIYARNVVWSVPDWWQFQDSFSHLNGYSATYYTYTWSLVIADDLFTQFQTHGLRDRVTAERYRQLVLAPGGSQPSAELVKAFLGRPISLDAYKAQLAKDQ